MGMGHAYTDYEFYKGHGTKRLRHWRQSKWAHYGGTVRLHFTRVWNAFHFRTSAYFW